MRGKGERIVEQYSQCFMHPLQGSPPKKLSLASSSRNNPLMSMEMGLKSQAPIIPPHLESIPTLIMQPDKTAPIKLSALGTKLKGLLFANGLCLLFMGANNTATGGWYGLGSLQYQPILAIVVSWPNLGFL